MDFVPGALVAGRYRLKKMVGSGGMGEVWAGDDTKNGVKVAVKHLLPTAAKHHEVVARFKREAYLLGRVGSDYVARVVDFFDDETYGLVLVMEFIDGPSLAHILEQRVLSVEEAVDLAIDLLRALQDLHNSKIVHRDLKPGNIIMRPLADGSHRATVVDFGISRLLPGKDENEVTGITRANIALGTVEYMAPEQILNSRDVTPVTDLYAVGIILFRAVKGHHAFGDRRGEELARAKLIEDAPPLDTGRQDEAARGLVAIVARALKKKPSQRFQSAAQMLQEIEPLQRLNATPALDFDDDSTTDSGETAVKRSPLAAVDDDDPGTVALPTPPSLRGAPPAPKVVLAPTTRTDRPPVSGVVAAPPPNRAPLAASASSAAQPAPIPRGSMPSVPDSGPRSAPSAAAARGSMPSIPEHGPRGSMPSIPDSVPGSRVSSDGAAPPMRASFASMPDYAPVVAPPPPAELTHERHTGVSKGTIALAILTSFAVGAAVGLIVAPTSPGAAPSACPPCASALPATAQATATAVEAANPAPIELDDDPPTDVSASSQSASTTATSSASARSSASAKPALTGKLPGTSPPPSKPSATAPPTSDGLGEDDPPPKATSTATSRPTQQPTTVQPDL
ncbi:MAG: protein kinase [Polyangiaceae bacterium]|nr:protein kinase [Polyangiaceae bacterium]